MMLVFSSRKKCYRVSGSLCHISLIYIISDKTLMFFNIHFVSDANNPAYNIYMAHGSSGCATIHLHLSSSYGSEILHHPERRQRLSMFFVCVTICVSWTAVYLLPFIKNKILKKYDCVCD